MVPVCAGRCVGVAVGISVAVAVGVGVAAGARAVGVGVAVGARAVGVGVAVDNRRVLVGIGVMSDGWLPGVGVGEGDGIGEGVVVGVGDGDNAGDDSAMRVGDRAAEFGVGEGCSCAAAQPSRMTKMALRARQASSGAKGNRDRHMMAHYSTGWGNVVTARIAYQEQRFGFIASPQFHPPGIQ